MTAAFSLAASPSPLVAAALTLQSTLDHSSYGHLRRLTCLCERNRVVLQGSVPSFYLKQLAQSLALQVVQSSELQVAVNVQSDDFSELFA